VSLVIGSLATGYGGLDSAVAAFTGAEVAWVADNDPDVRKILEHRFPGIPNLGDIREVDWKAVPRPDIVTAGFPCPDVSAAGLRAGLLPGNRSGLWLNIVQAIAVLHPPIVIVENVRGLLTARAHSDVEQCPWCMGDRAGSGLRAYGAVLGALSDLGFDAEGQIVSAADAGSCHKRERVFIWAWQAAADPGRDARAEVFQDRAAAAGGG
jgi:DNA (cytosine-5)-methyltransferase 1